MKDGIFNDRIAKLRAGDMRVFDELITEHAKSVRAFIALRSPSVGLIDEVAQETFVFAFRHMGEFKEGTNFGAWLRAIAYNILRSEIQRFAREQGKRAKYFDEWLRSMDAGDEPGEARAELLPALQSCLSEFNETQREMLTLRYSESWSAERIGERLRQTPGWVRTNMCRIRQALRACIEAKTAVQTSE